MMKIDVDLSGLDELEPEIKEVMKRFAFDGFAIFDNDRINHKIGNIPSGRMLRRQGIIIISNDRRKQKNVLSLNINIPGAENLLKNSWKNIIKELRR